VNIAGRVEISRLAELLGVRRVVAMARIVETNLHVTRKGHGTALPDLIFNSSADLFPDLLADGHALTSLCRVFSSRCARTTGAILRSVGKHFDEIVMQAVVELVLQMPGELGMIQIAGMNGEHVGVNGEGGVFQVNQNFDDAILLARGKGEQGMLVQAEVLKHLV